VSSFCYERGGERRENPDLCSRSLLITFLTRPALPSLSLSPCHSQARRKFGLLEKKGDYKARSDDFHKKEAAIARLRAKADARNPEEFSFGMVNKRTAGGVPVAGGAAAANTYSADELALMRTQDARYVAMAAGVEAKRVERLKASLHGLRAADAVRQAGARGGGDGGRPPAHTIFVDSPAEAAAFDAAAFFDTPANLLGRAHNRPRRAQLRAAGSVLVAGGAAASSSAPSPHERAAMQAGKRSAAAYKELAQRAGRLSKLRRLEGRLRLQAALQGKGGRRKVVGASAKGDPATYKWKRQRTR